MDACLKCPFADDCRLDPDAPCFLDSEQDSEFWQQVGGSDG